MTNKLSELIRKSVLNQYVDAEPVIRRWADEVAALEQKLTRRNDAANNWSRMYEEQKAEKEALEQRAERLEGALKRYGHHERDCWLNDDTNQPTCTCGYRQMTDYLEALAEEKA